VDEAHVLVKQRTPMEGNVVMLGTLLGACEKHENVSVGECSRKACSSQFIENVC
jgi:hypothetical protein